VAVLVGLRPAARIVATGRIVVVGTEESPQPAHNAVSTPPPLQSCVPAHSSSGLGRRPLTAVARVRIPYAPKKKNPANRGVFLFYSSLLHRSARANRGHFGPRLVHQGSCHTEVTYDPTPTPVGVAFGNFDAPGNFQVDVLVRVVRGGDGSGSVTGVLTRTPGEQIINCGPDCSQLVRYGRRVAVAARADADSSFAGWAGGVCATNSHCEFYAGAVTSIRAVFARRQPPPPNDTPPPTTKPPPPDNRRFVARIRRVSVVKTRAGRVVVARVSVNEVAGGRAQVRRARRVLTNRSVRLRVGVNTVRLPLRKAVARGRALFTLTLRSASGTRRTLAARFTVPRRR
jgi:hypothetical protein